MDRHFTRRVVRPNMPDVYRTFLGLGEPEPVLERLSPPTEQEVADAIAARKLRQNGSGLQFPALVRRHYGRDGKPPAEPKAEPKAPRFNPRDEGFDDGAA